MPETGVFGRDAELGSIEAFLSDVQRGPAALVLAGEAGIGKTILWEAAVEAANHRYGRVLSCRGIEAEASLSFAGLSELLAPVLADTMASLPTPRRRALEVALMLAEPGDQAPDAHVIGLAVLDVLRCLAEQGPLVVALDDLQWLDPSSASVLQVALRRLRQEPVGLLATARVAPELTVPIELERCFTEAQLARLSVGPLSLGALYHLLRGRLGLDLSRPELVQVHEATDANPFFALELGRELARQGLRVRPGHALPVPSSLAKLLGARLARLAPDTRDVLLVAAVAGRSTIEAIVAAHGERETAIAALGEAERDGVVELTDGRVRFAHPLFASVLYDEAPAGRLRAVHRALAWTATDIEERARHLARAAEGRDANVAAELVAAAEHAAARGAPTAGAELCELGADLTPDDPLLARQRRLRAARFHRLAGDGERAVALLERLLIEFPTGSGRAEVLLGLAATLRADPRTLVELCDEALAEAGDDDALAVRILAMRIAGDMWALNVHAALADARAALVRAERVGDPVLLAVAISRVGLAEGYTAETTPGLLERGSEMEERLGLVLEYFESPRFEFARHLMTVGQLDRARDILEEVEAASAARGDEASRVMAIWRWCVLEWQAGRWTRARDLATTAHELAEQAQLAHGRAWIGRIEVLLAADMGLAEQGRASAEESLTFARASSNELFTFLTLASLGHLELVCGNVEQAGELLRAIPARLLAGGANDPTIPVWADTIETLIALGELDQARVYLAPYATHAERCASPSAISAAARCQGVLATADDDLAGAFVAFDRALAALEGFTAPLDRGRALLAAGIARRQAQQRGLARDMLEESLRIFEGLGAPLWADKARTELRRISGRRPGSEELTETEHQVAAMAARGRSNKEIAAALYLGVSTVEAHLSHVYRKLGVRRTELATRLAIPSELAAISKDETTQT